MEIKNFWVVTHPLEGDALSDICSKEDWNSLQLLFAGGLKPSDIAGVYKDKKEARLKAQILLRLCGEITLDEALDAWEFANDAVCNNAWRTVWRGGTYPYIEGYSINIESSPPYGWSAFLFEKNADGTLNYEKYITLF